MFQHQTFEVRAMYAKHGLEVDLISREPDDHLAYELMFLGHLLARGVGFFEQGESGKMREVGCRNGAIRCIATRRTISIAVMPR